MYEIKTEIMNEKGSKAKEKETKRRRKKRKKNVREKINKCIEEREK